MVNLARQAIPAYFPHLTVERYRKGRRVTESEPLFAAYLFVQIRLSNETWRSVNSTRGITRLISFAEGRPSAVPEGVVEDLRERESRGELRTSEIVDIRPGNFVKLNFGPWAGQMGLVHRRRHERVEVLMDLLRRKTVLVCPVHALSLVSKRRATASAVAMA